jgi:hypothetical protein
MHQLLEVKANRPEEDLSTHFIKKEEDEDRKEEMIQKTSEKYGF